MSEKYKDFFVKIFSTLTSEKGQALVEYGLLLVLVAIVVILMLKGYRSASQLGLFKN